MKQRMAMGRLTPSAKCLWVESPELIEANSNDGEQLGQMASQPTLTEIAMAQHTTEVVVDSEPINLELPRKR